MLQGCASVAPPPGGPPDKAPPHIISVKPDSGAVVPNLKDEVVIQFDDVIDEMSGFGGRGTGSLTGLEKQVMLSPVRGGVKVEWHRSSVTLKPREGWKKRVYRLEILPGFVDLRRNRLDTAKTVLFSTGPEIGTARIGGIALKWIEQTILVRAVIEAVPLPDSNGYLTMADSGGQFNLTNLQPGKYIVYALDDANGDRHRGLREAYDSIEVTLDSSSNVALFTFPHDTVPPRPRTATAIDSVTARVEFTQALEPTASLDTAHVHVLEGPDSTPVAVVGVFTQRQYDSITTAQRAKADSAKAKTDSAGAARDTTRRAPPPGRPAAGAPGRQPVKSPVDTVLVRQLLARRPVPSDKIVIRLARPMKPETRYVVRVQGAQNLIGKKGDGDIGFAAPKAAAPADTTRRPPRTGPP